MKTREIYIEKLKTRLDKWNAYLGKLENLATKLKGQIKISFDESLTDIRKRRDIVETKLVQIKDAADNAFNDLKLETREARVMLVDAFSKAHDQVGSILESRKK
jgi:hypothetical protein